MKMRRSFGWMAGALLVASVVSNTSIVSADTVNKCSMTIDANVNTVASGKYATASGVCKEYINGFYVPDANQFNLTGYRIDTVEYSGQVFTMSFPNEGEAELTVHLVQKKQTEPVKEVEVTEPKTDAETQKPVAKPSEPKPDTKPVENKKSTDSGKTSSGTNGSTGNDNSTSSDSVSKSSERSSDTPAEEQVKDSSTPVKENSSNGKEVEEVSDAEDKSLRLMNRWAVEDIKTIKEENLSAITRIPSEKDTSPVKQKEKAEDEKDTSMSFIPLLVIGLLGVGLLFWVLLGSLSKAKSRQKAIKTEGDTKYNDD